MDKDRNKIEAYSINDINRLKILTKDIEGIAESIITTLPVGVCIWAVRDMKRIEALYLSDEYFNIVGYDKDSYAKRLKDVTSVIFEEDEKKIFENAELSIQNNSKFEVICRGYKANGQIAWFNVQGMPIVCEEETSPVFLSIISDVSSIMSEFEALKELKAIKDELTIAKQRYRILEETTPALLFEYLPMEDNMIFSYNFPENHERKIIHKYFEFLDKTPLVHKSFIPKFKAALLKACETPTKDKIEYLSEVSGRGFEWHRTIYSSVLDKEGNIISVMGRIYNVNDEILEKEKKEKLTQIDNLTGAFIKSAGYNKMEKTMSDNYKQNIETYLVMVDLDGFKRINDTMGHSIGDYVLKRFSQKAIELVHECGFVTRFGGDEFLLFVQEISEKELHEKLKELHRYVKDIPGYDGLEVGFSEGIVKWNNMTLSQAFEEADRRMYKKKKEKNGQSVCDCP